MSIGTTIIQSALEEIGAHSIAAPAAPETITRGRDVLNSMLHLWLSRGIVLGIVPLDAPGEELGEPPDATNAIIQNLALELSGNFDNGNQIVSAQLQHNARRNFVEITQLYQLVSIPDKVVSSTLPLGAGNRIGWTRRVFMGTGAVLKQ